MIRGVRYIPTAHMSTGGPYGLRMHTSGARYPGVPAKPARQHPKFGVTAFAHTKVGIAVLHDYGKPKVSKFHQGITFLAGQQEILRLCHQGRMRRGEGGWS